MIFTWTLGGFKAFLVIQIKGVEKKIKMDKELNEYDEERFVVELVSIVNIV